LEVGLLPSVFESELDREILLLADELTCGTEILPIRRLADAKRPVRLLHQTTGDIDEAGRRRLRNQGVGQSVGLQPRLPKTPEVQALSEGLDVVTFVQGEAKGHRVEGLPYPDLGAGVHDLGQKGLHRIVVRVE